MSRVRKKDPTFDFLGLTDDGNDIHSHDEPLLGILPLLPVMPVISS